MIAMLLMQHHVAITEIAPVEIVEVQGKLQMDAMHGYPAFVQWSPGDDCRQR